MRVCVSRAVCPASLRVDAVHIRIIFRHHEQS